ncbi:hypothetical protein FSP39_023065 [Pinctada imbricata]|uniref:RNA polymerase II subunit A C-terminal domain phosphatase n=1 Tax=Pinctada imbricata TaxID=66713 RepID=A0AA88XSP6_PINIB|nr:hypothetical protein FSP39_023065 [Pinctada imbricata]
MEELIEWVDEDDYLLYLEDILKRIHEAFYNFWDQAKSKSVYSSQKPDLKFIIPYVKRKVLKGTNILFSGVIPTNQPPENSRAYQVARNLGATVQKDFVPKRKNADNSGATTHVVAAKLGTVKVKTAQKHKYVKLVNVNWLWACAERLERCEEKLYTVGGTDSPSVESQVIKMKKRKNDGEVDNNSGETLKRIKMENTVDDSAEVMEVDAKPELRCEDPPAGSSKKSEIPLAGSSKDSENPKAGSNKDNDDPPAGTSQGSEDKSPGERRFSNSYNPFLAFSDLDLACMDKEVEDFMEEGGEDSEEEDMDRDSRIRSQVLSSGDDDGSSSEDSLSGETPRGWNIKRNRRSKSDDSSSSDHDNQEEVRAGDEESENELDKYEKTVAAFAPDTESSDAESVGSVDEEMAAAIEREFMS